MLAPLDFAHPVNQIINSSEGEADFEDIFNPGIYVSYGFEKFPLVIVLAIAVANRSPKQMGTTMEDI